MTVTLTLDQLAAVLGQPLPRGTQVSNWWTNTLGKSTARVWLTAGWRVRLLALRTNTPTVTFVLVALIALDGESNWFEGAQLLAMYLIVGMAFYFFP